MAQPEKGQTGKQGERLPHPPSKQAEQPAGRDESPEQIREGSQTAQDRAHTNRGGDDQTAPTKEFPS
jgi:hypothetical protein